MGYNKSRLAFKDIEGAFDKAVERLEAGKGGVRIWAKSRSDAIVLRSRFNYYRQLDRKDNTQVYPPGDPKHGVSTYDQFVLQVRGKDEPDNNYVYIIPRSTDDLIIEDIEIAGE
jgi:hypothetical protein